MSTSTVVLIVTTCSASSFIAGAFLTHLIERRNPFSRLNRILRKFEDEADEIKLGIEGGRMQTSSTGDEILGELRLLKELLRNRWFAGE